MTNDTRKLGKEFHQYIEGVGIIFGTVFAENTRLSKRVAELEARLSKSSAEEKERPEPPAVPVKTNTILGPSFV